MILARVVGTVVATRKDERLEGRKLLVCRPVSPEGKTDSGYVISVDTVGAGDHETVLLVAGSSARMAAGMKESPVDNAIVGIVDEVRVDAEVEAEKRVAAVASSARNKRA
jgi:ethanolamine utilization protein EutN